MDDERQQSELFDYVPVPQWRKRHGGPFFPSDTSVIWFIKMHRKELVASGVLITRGGRSPSLVHFERFSKVAMKILRREARARTSVAA